MIDFKTLPNLSDREEVKKYLTDIANQIKDIYKVDTCSMNVFEDKNVVNTENEFHIDYFENIKIYISYKNDKGDWWIEIKLYDPTNNDCFEDKTCVYEFYRQNSKTYEGCGGIVNKFTLQDWLDTYLEKKDYEETRLF